MEFVSWDDDIPNIYWINKMDYDSIYCGFAIDGKMKNVPNHQLVDYIPSEKYGGSQYQTALCLLTSK